jgi:hypothetical protein
MPTDGFWIIRNTSGTLLLDNVVCLNPLPGNIPKIKVDSAGGNFVSCVASGVASPTPIDTAFSLGSGAYLSVLNYHQVDINNIIQAVTPLRIVQGGIILFKV